MGKKRSLKALKEQAAKAFKESEEIVKARNESFHQPKIVHP